MPAFADSCLVYIVVTPNEEPQLISYAHRDPEKEGLLGNLAPLFETDVSKSIAAIKTGIVTDDITPSTLSRPGAAAKPTVRST